MKKSISKADSVPIKVIQNLEFGILKYIRDICDQNGLRYYLAYGTLIGAVRHQGFIPWDDDVDIHMPRPDYMKFVEIVKEKPHPYYRLISRETESKFTHILSKMIDTRTKLTQKTDWSEKVQLGVYVDIFIFDGAGNSLSEAETTYLAAYSIYHQWWNAVTVMFLPGWGRRASLRFWLQNKWDKILGPRYYMNKHTEFCILKPYDDYVYVGAMGVSTEEPSRNIWERKCFGDGTPVVFNGEVFQAPSHFDAVLRPEYGDYMVLPPSEKRHSTHKYELIIPNSLMQNGEDCLHS